MGLGRKKSIVSRMYISSGLKNYSELSRHSERHWHPRARLELELGLGCGTPVLRQHRKRDTLTHVRDASASVSLISR